MDKEINVSAIIDGIKILMKMLDNEVVREFAAETISFAKKRVCATDTKMDDYLVLPVLVLIEKAAGLNK